jgi:hypothetical protein
MVIITIQMFIYLFIYLCAYLTAQMRITKQARTEKTQTHTNKKEIQGKVYHSDSNHAVGAIMPAMIS